MKSVKRILSCVLVMAMFVTGMTVPSSAVMAETEQPDESVGEYSLHYRGDAGWDVDASFAGKAVSDIANLRGTFPTAYSSVEKGYVTSVKDQGNEGTCWAQSAISAAETSYIMKYNANPANVDFSEYHLVHYTYNTPADLYGITGEDTFYLTSGNSLDVGGNNYFTMQVWANWIGVSDATVNEFSSSDVDNYNNDAMAYDDVVHLRDAYIVAMPTMQGDASKIDMQIVKSMIMQYGSVTISYHAEGTENDGYCYHPDYEPDNHAVTIVGWDDTIEQENFEYQDDDVVCYPDGDGAWLVKNSWGTSSGNEGYFWLSYYDATIAYEGFVFHVETADNYDNNYHMDNSAYTDGACTVFDNVEASAAVFQADSVESLEAVGFYTQSLNLNYEIRVYTGVQEGALPNTGTLELTQSGKQSYIGFHTVDLNRSISLKSGERYAIVVTLFSDDETEVVSAPVSMSDTRYGLWYNSIVYAKEGQSYIGNSVDELVDLNEGNTSFAEGYDVCIKALTNEVTLVTEEAISLNVASAELDAGATLQLSATVTPSNATFKGVTFTSSDATLATVDANGLVTANSTGKTGTVTITATSEYANKTATCTIYIKPVLVSGITLPAKELTVKEGESTQLLVTLMPSNATNPMVRWTSSDTSIAVVDDTGKVTALKCGVAVITATAVDGSGVTTSCTITVKTDKAGWSYENGTWYYYKDGAPLTGWLYDGAWYYLDSTGAMLTGWVNDNGTWYYMNSSGAMQTGWILDGGTWYYLKSSGAMATGWLWDGSNWYYLKSSGAMAIGWIWDGANWYYLTGSGVMATGWLWDGANWYYLTSSGAMATGWVYTGGEWYYLNSSGAMATGWIYTGGEWYYLKSSGEMVTGRYKVGKTTYYFNSSGAWIR